jgi:prepilin-type N-terminal cleavage/methylation domain-containing protein
MDTCKVLPDYNTARGFTLVEIMMVMVILSVLAFFVAPEVMNWRPNMRLTDASQDLYANMQNAKVSAIEQNENVVVSFTVPGSYEIFVDDGAGGGTARNNVKDGTEQTLTLDDNPDSPTFNTSVISLPADVIFDGGTDFNGGVVTGFTPRGLVISGNTGAVIMRRTDSSKWYRITLGAAGSLTTERKTSAAASWE